MAVNKPQESITARQLELIAMLASGYDYSEIASAKFLSYNTVRNDLHAAKDRIGAKSLTHLAVIAFDFGLIRRHGVGYRPVQEERVIG